MTEKFVRGCGACQAYTPQKYRDPIATKERPFSPFEMIDVDFIGPFPNQKYIFLMVDEYSRFPVAEVVSSTSFEAIRPILEKTFATFGIPKSLN